MEATRELSSILTSLAALLFLKDLDPGAGSLTCYCCPWKRHFQPMSSGATFASHVYGICSVTGSLFSLTANNWYSV
jgi:hypothetical protein